MSLFNKISELRFTVVLVVIGFVAAVLSFYDVSGKINDLTIKPLQSPNLYLLSFGTLAVLCSFVFTVLQENLLDWRPDRKIKKTKTGFEMIFKTARICIHFGLLQTKVRLGDLKTAVVLPANDLFDDSCFDDTGIALGGYLAHHFSHSEIVELKEQRNLELKKLTAKPIDDGLATTDKSYGVGSCLFLEKSGHRLIVAAVSTKRRTEGVNAEIYYVHRAMREIFRTVAEKELNTIFVPVIGSGKGGVPRRIALLSLLNAVCENVCRSSGHHLKEVHIIVFKKDDETEPELSRAQVRHLLQLVLKLWL